MGSMETADDILTLPERLVAPTDQGQRAFHAALLVALVCHAALLIEVARSVPRSIGDRSGNPDAISVELVTEADLKSRETVAMPPPGAPAPAAQPPPSPPPTPQAEAPPQPQAPAAPPQPQAPAAPPPPSPPPPDTAAEPPVETPPPPQRQAETPKPEAPPQLKPSLPDLADVAPTLADAQRAAEPADAKPAPAEPQPKPAEPKSDAAEATSEPKPEVKSEPAPPAPAPPKAEAPPAQKSPPQKQARLEPSPRDLSSAPPGRSAGATRPPGITRSGENDEFGLNVVRALRSTMPPPRGTFGRVTVRLVLTQNGDLAEVQVIERSGTHLDRDVVFATKQTYFPLPPHRSTVLDRTFVIRYVYR